MKGNLYVCPTPIGNLEDITVRVLNTLKEVDFIAAEDTRHTIKLLNHYEIKKPLISCHEHNEIERSKSIINRIINGESCAIVSDAGMPGISDPGEIVIKEAINNNINIIGLPGPTASILALIVSGLDTKKFVFEGFLPQKKKERINRLEKIKNEERTIILYESPHRLIKCLNDIKEVLGNRKMSFSRELTKKYEEVFRGTINEALVRYENESPRGEFVLIIEGNKNPEKSTKFDISIEEHIEKYLKEGYTKKDAVKLTANDRNLPKNDVYKVSLKL